MCFSQVHVVPVCVKSKQQHKVSLLSWAQGEKDSPHANSASSVSCFTFRCKLRVSLVGAGPGVLIRRPIDTAMHHREDNCIANTESSASSGAFSV